MEDNERAGSGREDEARTRHDRPERAGGTTEGWKKFLRNHPGVFVLFVIAAALASAGAASVFLWFAGHAQSTGLAPAALALWTMGNLVTFILHLVFWVLLFVGVPAAVAGAAGWRWWRNLPERERAEYRSSRGSSRKTDGSGAVSLLFNTAFAVKVYLDGNWNVPIASWDFDYVVSSVAWIAGLGAIVIGIPLCIGAVWWLRREMTKDSCDAR